MSAATPFFREVGEGDAVVCIHASASSSGQWRPLMEQLSERYRLIAPDLLGYGRSPAWLVHDQATFWGTERCS